MPRYELWSTRDCEDTVPDKMITSSNLPLEVAKAQFETLIHRWEEEVEEYFFDDTEECNGFESKVLPGAGTC